MSEDEARLEADVFLSIIKGKQFEFPVYYDVEEKKQFALGKEKVSAIMRAFLEKVEAAGYFVGLYGSASSLTTHTADDIKSRATPSGWHTGSIRPTTAAHMASGSTVKRARLLESTAMWIWISATRISRPSSRVRG